MSERIAADLARNMCADVGSRGREGKTGHGRAFGQGAGLRPE